MWKSLALKVLGVILPMLSDPLKQLLDGFIDELDKKAKETSNPIDDLAVDLLKALFGK